MPSTHLRAQVTSFLYIHSHWLPFSVALERPWTAFLWAFPCTPISLDETRNPCCLLPPVGPLLSSLDLAHRLPARRTSAFFARRPPLLHPPRALWLWWCRWTGVRPTIVRGLVWDWLTQSQLGSRASGLPTASSPVPRLAVQRLVLKWRVRLGPRLPGQMSVSAGRWDEEGGRAFTLACLPALLQDTATPGCAARCNNLDYHSISARLISWYSELRLRHQIICNVFPSLHSTLFKVC